MPPKNVMRAAADRAALRWINDYLSERKLPAPPCLSRGPDTGDPRNVLNFLLKFRLNRIFSYENPGVKSGKIKKIIQVQEYAPIPWT